VVSALSNTQSLAHAAVVRGSIGLCTIAHLARQCCTVAHPCPKTSQLVDRRKYLMTIVTILLYFHWTRAHFRFVFWNIVGQISMFGKIGN